MNRPEEEEKKDEGADGGATEEIEKELEKGGEGDKKEPPVEQKRTPPAGNDPVSAVADYQRQERKIWTELQKKFPDLKDVRDEMELELDDPGYTPAHRLNTKLLEKVYWMAKGRTSKSAPPPPVKKENNEERRVSRGYPPESGLNRGAGGEGGGEGAPNLTDEERAVSQIFDGVSEEDYEKSKKSKRFIKPFEPADRGIPQNANAADLAFARLNKRARR